MNARGRHAFVERMTQAYLTATAALVTAFHATAPPGWQAIVAVHLLVALALEPLARTPPTLAGVWGIFRTLGPMALYPLLYCETGYLNQTFVRGYFDAEAMAWEARLFGGQPSLDFGAWLQWWPVSESLHLAYVSFYPTVLGVGLALYAWRPVDARRYVATLSFTFYVCYATYLFLPIAGPHGLRETPAAGPVQTLVAFLYRLELPGAAFPSSHVAAALTALVFSWRAFPRLRGVHAALFVAMTASTVLCGFHYAIDALAGLVVGAGLTALGDALYRWIERPEARAVLG